MLSTKKILTVAYPIILGGVAQNILLVTDTAFLGQLGKVALGGGVIGVLFYQVLLMLGWGVSLGGQIIIARRLGEGDKRSIGRIVDHLFYFLVPFALVLTLVFSIFSSSILGMLVRSGHVLGAGLEFFNYRIVGLTFAFVAYIFNAFYVGVAHTKVITAATVVMVIVNIVLDYGLMFGKFGLPNMGIAGAALASVIAEVSSCVAYIVFTATLFNFKSYRLFRFKKFSINMLNRIFGISWPLMFQFSLSIFVWFVIFLFIEKMGEVQLAVSNIVRSVYNVIIIPIWGFASATNTFVSQYIGKGKNSEVVPIIYKVVRIAIAAVAILSVLCFVFGRYVVAIYTSDPVVAEQVKPVLHIVEIAALGMAGGFVLFNGVSGTGKTRVSFAIEIITLSLYVVWAYLAAIVFKFPLPIVWICEIIYGVLTMMLSTMYLRSNRWLGTSV